jgi:hypothetical protein
MSTPTQIAETAFTAAVTNFSNAQHHITLKNQLDGLGSMALALQQTAAGLRDLSVGVRATYVLLEEVKRLLQQQRR